MKRIVGHPVLLRLVLEYSLAMADCHWQPYQGIFAGQGLHHQSPVLKSWTQKLNNLRWHSFIGLCFFSVVLCGVLHGFGVWLCPTHSTRIVATTIIR